MHRDLVAEKEELWAPSGCIGGQAVRSTLGSTEESSRVVPDEAQDQFSKHGCPRCGNSDGDFMVDDQWWRVCHAHRIRWCVGVLCEFDRIESEGAAEWWYKVVDMTPAGCGRLCKMFEDVVGQLEVIGQSPIDPSMLRAFTESSKDGAVHLQAAARAMAETAVAQATVISRASGLGELMETATARHGFTARKFEAGDGDDIPF